MPTKTPLYPKGFEFTDADLSTLVDPTHPTVMPLASAAAIQWQSIEASALVSVIVHDFPTVGSDTTISLSLTGQRIDFFGAPILPTNPRALVGVEHAKSYVLDYSAPMRYPDTFAAGQGFGPDNTYGGTYTFSGLMWFNRVDALPAVDCTFTVTCSNGAVFQMTVTEPITSQKQQGNFLTIDGQGVTVWFAWSGAAVPSTAEPQMSVIATTTAPAIWP